MTQIRIDDEFRALIPPLTTEEREQLMMNVMRDGVQSPFVVWDEESILLDGHNRHDICADNAIDFPSPLRMSFASRTDAKIWIIKNQFGRRNLTPYQKSELALLLAPLLEEKGKANQKAGGKTGGRGREKGSQNSANPIEAVDSREELAKIAGVSHDTIAKVKKIVSEAPEPVKEKLRRGETSIHAEYKKLAKQEQRIAIAEHVRGNIVSDLESLVGQKFGCIYADPPWRYGNQSTRAATDDHYPTMSVEEICALPIADIAADQSHLHLWTTNGFLFDAIRVLEAWGFEYKSCFVWVKPQMGIGNYWRVAHEFLLLGVRGGITFRDHGQRSWLESPRGKHSAKPDKIGSLIEKVSPSPYLELFGRSERTGWTVFGNQIPKPMFATAS